MTTSITTFTRSNVAQLQAELRQALDAISAKHGIRVGFGRGTFSANAFTFKVEGAVVTANGTVMTREAEAFRQLAHAYGMRPEDLGRSIPFRGGAATIVGLNSRAARMPVLVDDESGKRWKISAEHATFGLSRANAS